MLMVFTRKDRDFPASDLFVYRRVRLEKKSLLRFDKPRLQHYDHCIEQGSLAASFWHARLSGRMSHH